MPGQGTASLAAALLSPCRIKRKRHRWRERASRQRYPGQRADAASGLNYNYFRDYEPSSGRYLESDPIGLAGGISGYAYVGGEPLKFFDPEGLKKWKGKINYGEGALGYKLLSVGSWNRVAVVVDSECVAGRKLHATVIASHWSFGLSPNIGPPTFFLGDVELDDGATTLAAENLAGPLSFTSGGGVGTASGAITAGSAHGTFHAKGTTLSAINFSGQGELGPWSSLEQHCICNP